MIGNLTQKGGGETTKIIAVFPAIVNEEWTENFLVGENC